MARRHRRKSHEHYGHDALDQHVSPVPGELPGALRQRPRGDTGSRVSNANDRSELKKSVGENPAKNSARTATIASNPTARNAVQPRISAHGDRFTACCRLSAASMTVSTRIAPEECALLREHSECLRWDSGKPWRWPQSFFSVRLEPKRQTTQSVHSTSEFLRRWRMRRPTCTSTSASRDAPRIGSCRVTAESEDFFRSSETQLDGEYSARVTVVRFRELPPGGYEIRAELIVSNGRTADVAKRTVEIF